MEWNSTGSVALPALIVPNAIFCKSQSRANCFDDAPVSLMRHHHIRLVQLHAGLRQPHHGSAA
jgi:hypothetical protein